MLYLLENEAAWATANFKNGVLLRSLLSDDKIAQFLTKTQRKKCKNSKKILLGECYLLFEEQLQEKNCLSAETEPRNKPKFWIKSTRK